MNSVIAIVPVTIAAYAATNLDNFVLLVALRARYREAAAAVVLGFLVAALILVLSGYWVSTAARYAPVEYLGLLGLLPIVIGLIGVASLLRGVPQGHGNASSAARGGSVLAVTLISQLGNGTDTLLTLGALFADSKPGADLVIAITLGVTAIVCVLAAEYALRHPLLASVIDRHAHRVTPFILIFVGIYILANTATDLLAG